MEISHYRTMVALTESGDEPKGMQITIQVGWAKTDLG